MGIIEFPGLVEGKDHCEHISSVGVYDLGQLNQLIRRYGGVIVRADSCNSIRFV